MSFDQFQHLIFSLIAAVAVWEWVVEAAMVSFLARLMTWSAAMTVTEAEVEAVAVVASVAATSVASGSNGHFQHYAHIAGCSFHTIGRGRKCHTLTQTPMTKYKLITITSKVLVY